MTMYTGIILFSVVVVGFAAIVGTFLLIQWRTRKAVEGKLLCTFITHSGARFDKLLPITNNTVRDDLGGGEQEYYFKPRTCWNTLYPINRPGLLQVTVPSAVFAQDNPEPLNPFESAMVATAEILRNTQDEVFSRMMVDRANREMDEDKRVNALANPTILYVLGGGALLAAAAAAYMCYSLQSAVGALQSNLDRISEALGIGVG